MEQTDKKSLLIIQSEHGDQNSELIACARYSIQRELQEIFQNESMNKVCVIFLIQLTGMTGSQFSGFQVYTQLTNARYYNNIILYGKTCYDRYLLYIYRTKNVPKFYVT